MGADGPLPCTPAGIVELLRANDVPVEGKHVVVIGRGLTIGRPLALLLAMQAPGCNAAVTVVHTGVEDLAGLVRQGDVVVAAAGRAGLVTAGHGQARGRGGRGRHLVGGQEAPVRRRRVGGRGGRLDHPADRRGRADDPGHAAAQRRAGRRAGVMSGAARARDRPAAVGQLHRPRRRRHPQGQAHRGAPGKRLSYQRHARRSEHWFIVRGTALVTLDGDGQVVGDSSTSRWDRPPDRERSAPMVFVEVQHGEYFGEDDIVRLEDDSADRHVRRRSHPARDGHRRPAVERGPTATGRPVLPPPGGRPPRRGTDHHHRAATTTTTVRRPPRHRADHHADRAHHDDRPPTDHDHAPPPRRTTSSQHPVGR